MSNDFYYSKFLFSHVFRTFFFFDNAKTTTLTFVIIAHVQIWHGTPVRAHAKINAHGDAAGGGRSAGGGASAGGGGGGGAPAAAVAAPPATPLSAAPGAPGGGSFGRDCQTGTECNLWSPQ